MANIMIFEKNKLDLDFTGASISVTDSVASNTGAAFVSQLRDRSNFTGWGTTGSSDAANTQLDIDLKDAYELTYAILVNHNFKAYTLQYWNGSSFVDFPTAINVSGNTDTTTIHTFTSVNARLLRLIISETMVADADKLMSQLIFTRRVNQLTGQPEVRPMSFDSDRKALKLVSGRHHISEKQKAIRVRLSFPPFKNQNDMNAVKDLYESFEGRLLSFVGGDDSGIPITVPGFRKQDFFLLKPTNDFDVSWRDGRFAHGQVTTIDMVEAR